MIYVVFNVKDINQNLTEGQINLYYIHNFTFDAIFSGMLVISSNRYIISVLKDQNIYFYPDS